MVAIRFNGKAKHTTDVINIRLFSSSSELLLLPASMKVIYEDCKA